MFFSSLATLDEFILQEIWPAQFFSPPSLPEFLKSIFVLDFRAVVDARGHVFQLSLGVEDLPSLKIPGFDSVSVTIDSGPKTFPDDSSGAVVVSPNNISENEQPDPEPEPYDYLGITFFNLDLILGPQSELVFSNIQLVFRFASDVLRPVDAQGQAVDGPVEIRVPGSFTIDQNFNVSVEGFDAINLEPVMIGNTGFVVSGSNIKFDLSRTSNLPEVTAAGFDESFIGIFIGQAALRFPGGSALASSTISLTSAAIGSGGVSGTATLSNGTPQFDPVGKVYNGPGAGTLFGVPFWLSTLQLSLKENAFVNAVATGELLLPFFEKRAQVKIGFDGNGGISLQVTGVVGQNSDPSGVFTIEPVQGVGFEVLSLGVEERGGRGLFRLNTKLHIARSVGDLDWPVPEINGLVIDSDGNVEIEGGWVDLPKQLTMDLYAAKIELTKIGFGTDDDGVHGWIGFSGGLKIVDGVQAGASVDGLRIHYRKDDPTQNPTVSLDGVGIEINIPDVLQAKGSLSLKNKEMAGGVQVTILPIQLTIGGQFVAGTLSTGQKTFGIFLHAELPAGLPLGTTGLGLYGMAGLYAENRKPDKKPDEGWYQNPDGSPGWYLRKVPPANQIGVEDLGGKWIGNAGSRAFGAGVTLGTFGDNGFKFNGRVLLVLVFPGPTILIEGKANLFKKRAELEGADPTFRALAVIEPGTSFLLSLDAHYKYKASGELMDLRGSAEAFFDFKDASKWHVILGFKDDPNRRIRARLFKLYDVSSYFELRPGRLDIGASWGIDKSWTYGSLGVRLAASLEEAATVSWHPNHFTGFLNLQGRAELRAFGHGVGVNAGAKITGDVFDPFHLKGDFHVGIDLPWPLPDIGATVTLEWTKAMSAAAPPLPLPLQQASAEFAGYPLPTGSPVRPMRWPFVRGTNLLPSYDQGDAEAGHGHPAGPDATAAVFSNAPIIPPDAQIGLNFSRPVKDPHSIGNNPNDVPTELIGDPFKSAASEGFRNTFTLSDVTLEKIGAPGPNETPGSPLPSGASGVGWVKVASGGILPDAVSGVPTIIGSWTLAAPPDNPPVTPAPADKSVASTTLVAQSKLMIGAKSPLYYTALTSQTWDDWFTDTYPDYPCTPFDPDEKLVAVFTQAIGSQQTMPVLFDSPAFRVIWAYGGDITALTPATVNGVLGPLDRGLRVDDFVREDVGSSSNTVVAPPGSNEVRIHVATPASPLKHPSGEGVFSTPGTAPPTIFGGTVTVRSLDAAGGEIPNQIAGSEGHTGLRVMTAVELIPDVSASLFDIQAFTPNHVGDPDFRATSAVLQGYDSNGNPAGGFVLNPTHTRGRLFGPDIARVRITLQNTDGAPLLVESVYFRAPVVAVANAASDPTVQYGPFTEDDDGVITVTGTDLGSVHLQPRLGGEFAIVELSVPSRRDTLLRHTIAALQQFAKDDPIFEPDTNYRFRVKTLRTTASASSNVPASMKGDDNYVETVYFRTAALPGIGLPSLPAGIQPGAATGFEDLSFYVRRTVPAVPPPEGGHTSPAKAFYRAYDVNVEFTEQAVHVQLMYKLGHRDLTLRLFDATNQPLRDTAGRVMLGPARWGKSDDPAVSQAASRWIGIVAKNTCVPSPPASSFEILSGERISVPSEAALLDPERLLQARIVPMLLRESFEDVRFGQKADGQFQLDRWHATATGATWLHDSRDAVDPTTGQTVGKVHFATVNSTTPTTLEYHGPLASRGETGRPDHPSQWTDFRASVQLRWQDGEVGFEFRRSDAGLLRVTLDRTGSTQRLITVVGTTSTTVSENRDVVFPSVSSDVVLTVECIGDTVTVYQNLAGEPLGDPIFAPFSPAPTAPGTVALFTNVATAPQFTEILVHDLRADPATAHRFDFITSRYANFYHHLGSFDDRTFDAPHMLAASDFNPQLQFAFTTPTAVDFDAPTPAPVVSEAEQHAFKALEDLALGPAALRSPERVEVLRVSNDPSMTALLIRSPEPIRWERTELYVETSGEATDAVTSPAKFALTGVGFSGGAANQETVTVLIRETGVPTGYTIQWRPLGDPNAEWTDHFIFGTEAPLAEGTQVRVHSGVPETIAHDVGIALRFAASDPTLAQPQFPAAGVELRLLTPDGEVAHQKMFLPDGDFAILAASAIRKADGTAFFLTFPPTAESVRLNFSFIRKLVQPQPALRQAGSEQPERFALVVSLS